MQKKALITGVSGQDGSLMADYLLSLGLEVYGMVRHSASVNNENYKHNLDNPKFHVVSGDLTDFACICHLVREIQPDYLINLAAMSFVAESWNSPISTFEIDANGVLHCLEALRLHKPDCRFYSAGTSEQLSEVDYVPQDENHRRTAKSPYGAAKIAAEQLVRVYRHSYGMYAVHGILFNHEGTRRNGCFVTRKITKAVARIKKALDNGENFEPLELGFLDSERDWSDAEDFVRGIWMMLNQKEFSEKVINEKTDMAVSVGDEMGILREYVLSSGECHSVREFVEKAFEAAGITGQWDGEGVKEEYSTVLSLPSGDGIRKGILVKINEKFYRPFEVTKLHGTSKAINHNLGWKPEVSFDELVKKMVENDIKLLDKE